MNDDKIKEIAEKIDQAIWSLNGLIEKAAKLGLKVEVENTPLQEMADSFPHDFYNVKVFKEV